MNIALINGSPKHTGSASGVLLEELKGLLAGETIAELNLHGPVIPESLPAELFRQDALVFAFPLYVDGIPSHLLRCLIKLEELFRGGEAHPTVYAIVNCGFYEGTQNRHALRMMQCWCERAGLKWGRGVGAGSGGMIAGLSKVPPGKGPKKNVSTALAQLAGSIRGLSGGENMLVNPNFPRIAYHKTGELGWRSQARANGLQTKDLFRKW